MSSGMRVMLAMAMVLVLVGSAEAFLGGRKTPVEDEAAALPPPPATPMEIAMNPIDFVGRLVYKKMGGVNRILRFLTGKQISEYALLVTLRIACNLLYVCTVLVGFLFLPKNVMIVVGIMTSLIGPLIALIMIGILVAFIGIFVYAPCISMNVICIGVFCSGPLGQKILKHMGFDRDNDGDVDFIDVMRFVADKVPRALGGGPTGRLHRACDFINDAGKDQKHLELLAEIRTLKAQLAKAGFKPDGKGN